MAVQKAPSATLFYFRGARFPSPPVSSQGLELVESFEVREDDVFVSAFNKSGTTWTQQIISLVTAGSNFSEVSKIPLGKRVPWLERADLHADAPPIISQLKDSPSPRLMKTHLPYNMLPKQAREGKGKIVYCARNPKDVVVSVHNMNFINDYLQPLSWEETLHEFLSAPPANLWWNVIPEYWSHKDDANLLFIKYEDIKKDLRGHVVKIAEFLGRSLSVEQIDEVTANCTFAAMKDNQATNLSRDPVLKEKVFKRGNEHGIEFMRKGQVGDWRNWFSPQQLETFEAFHSEKMAGTDLTFEDEE
ncbi:sulfotransferase family cytosolic 1B member 1-like [Branchiostoma floridae]|uniref:Sulfotransferase n=1 Tax=Branchiostoma floridae TaxID=7739 RepID=A0A9J7KS36_BRAFL|nr:sulfotransferase family cytosolic 1B member 1-like [Branchiostoma floridae]